jgi:hypothetical protein
LRKESKMIEMSKTVLMVSAAEGTERCARELVRELGLTVRIAPGRRAGLAAVRREEYGMVIVEEGLVEGDPAWADLLWQNAGFVLPLVSVIAEAGCVRLVREVRSVLLRREHERTLARREATAVLQNELKSSVTGLLLQSELALREPSVPAALAPRLRELVELAGALGAQLRM